MHRAMLLVLVAAVGMASAALLSTGCGSAASAAVEASPSPTSQPPDWLLEQMANLARNAGDAQASAWWTLTTLEKAVVVEGGGAPSPVANPDKGVYVFIVHGDFTRWLWSLRSSTSAPDYGWVVELIDADSHIADMTGTSEKPFDTRGLAMQQVVLPNAAEE